jgi:nucleoid DNA-binding protein
LKAFGKFELKERKKKTQVEERTAEETLTSGSNDPDPAGNNALQGDRESGERLWAERDR